jgi:hypothetical protein
MIDKSRAAIKENCKVLGIGGGQCVSTLAAIVFNLSFTLTQTFVLRQQSTNQGL